VGRKIKQFVAEITGARSPVRYQGSCSAHTVLLGNMEPDTLFRGLRRTTFAEERLEARKKATVAGDLQKPIAETVPFSFPVG